jgi:hypothetical protein
MNSGKLIKFLEFKRGAMNENAIRLDSYNNRIYSTWEKERKAELLSLQNQLRLKPIYKNPPPIWMHPVLCALFGDSFLEGTGLEGGSLSASSSVFDIIFDHLLKNLVSCSKNSNDMMISSAPPPPAAAIAIAAPSIETILSEFHFTHEDIQTLNYIHLTIKNLQIFSKKYDLAKKNGKSQLIFYYKFIKKYILNLKNGETLLIPGGIGDHVVLYILEKEDKEGEGEGEGSVDSYRFSVVNTNPYVGLDYHQCDPSTSPPFLKYQIILTITNISQKKIFDDLFWGILLKLSILSSKENTPEKLYDLLLPYLVDKPIDQIVYESSSPSSQQRIEYLYPQKSDVAYVQTILESISYLLQRHGINQKIKIKQIIFLIQTQFLDFLQHDLQFIQKISNNEKKIIELCCNEYSRAAAQLGKGQDKNGSVDNYEHQEQQEGKHEQEEGKVEECLNISQLSKILNFIQNIKMKLDENLQLARAAGGTGASGEDGEDQPIIHLDDDSLKNLENHDSQFNSNSLLIFPFFDKLKRLDDVNGFAGSPILLPQYVPIDMFQIPSIVQSFSDIIQAIRYCDRLCTLISVQQDCVKNRNFLKVSLIEHTFIKILPCPKSQQGQEQESCLWQTPMSYSCQLDLCICLGRILEHFISSVYSLHTNKPLDALKLIITGVIAAMVDVTIRHVSTDQTSEFCLHYLGERGVAGRGGGLGPGYGISMASFDTQSETIELHSPELCVARAAILNYFDEQKSLKKIFNWENGHQLDEPTAEFISNIATTLAFPTDPKSIIGYLTTRNQLINKNYPEFHILRYGPPPSFPSHRSHSPPLLPFPSLPFSPSFLSIPTLGMLLFMSNMFKMWTLVLSHHSMNTLRWQWS